jgi:hypothetical protein
MSELPRTDKLYHFSVSFLIFLCVLEKTLGKIVIFLCVLKKTHRQNKKTHKTNQFSTSVDMKGHNGAIGEGGTGISRDGKM